MSDADVIRAAAIEQPIAIGRYVLHREIARGGMATIHIARLMGDQGFDRLVAAKRLHPELAADAEFVAMFLDEAKIASKVRHRNIIPVLDVVSSEREVILVQEYVHGVPLQWLLRSLQEAKAHVPPRIVAAIACQLLAGLQATHDAVDELGAPLRIVHRDVSPQNVLIAADGTAKLLDFGVARAALGSDTRHETMYKGKLAYSAPEQLLGAATAQSDLYSLSVLVWEMVVGQRLHRVRQSRAQLVERVLRGQLPSICEVLSDEHERGRIGADDWAHIQRIAPVVHKGLATDTRERWADAATMEGALRAAVQPDAPGAVASWLRAVGGRFLEQREALIAGEEASWRAARAFSDEWATRSAVRSSSIRLRVPPDLLPDVMGGGTTSLAPARPLAGLALRAVVGVALAAGIAGGLTLLAPGGHKPSARPTTTSASPMRPAPPELLRNVAQQAQTATPQTPASGLQKPASAPQTAARAPSASAATTIVPERKSLSAEPAVRGTLDEAPAPAHPTKAAATSTLLCDPPYYFAGTKKIFKTECL